MRYNRALLPLNDADEALLAPVRAEMQRREHGPICAQCQFSPLDEHDLPPIALSDSRPTSARVRQFRCEARGTMCEAGSGHGCRHFDRRIR